MGLCGWLPVPADVLSRAGLAALTLALGLLATSCGGGGSNGPIKIAFLTDCTTPLSSPAYNAGAELPFLQRGAKLRGSQPSDGVTGITVASRRVRLLLGCESYGNFASLLGGLRRLVQYEGADIVVEPNFIPEGLVTKEYARSQPEITFSTTSGEQSTTLEQPAPNLFRFGPDTAQGSAGLGAYAHNTLHWRTAVTVGENDPNGWSEVAGFVAEFCALGGNIRKRIWTTTLKKNFADTVERIPRHGVDGVVFPSDLQPASNFMRALAKRYPSFGKRLLVNAAALGPPTHRMLRLVGVSTMPLQPTPKSPAGRFNAASQSYFPGIGADFYSYDAMEPVLRALEQVHGDLSNGERRFQKALAGVHFRAPNGETSLDGTRQAIAPTYLERVEKDAQGKLVVRQIGVIPGVEQTFGGYFGPGTPPPGRKQPACKHVTKPPPWVSSVPTTR